MSRLSRMVFQLVFIIALYFVLDYFNLVSWYLVLALFLIVIVYVYLQSRIRDNELYLEIMCNTTLYLRRLEKSKAAKQQNDAYFLGLAYAAMYQGNIVEAKEQFAKVHSDNFTHPLRQRSIYIRIAAHLAFQDQDKETLSTLLQQATDEEYTKLVGYINALLLMVDNKYEDAVELLKDITVKEQIRLHQVELEYLLALCLYKVKRYNDASAVFAIVVKRGYGIYLTDVAYDTYIELQDSGLLTVVDEQEEVEQDLEIEEKQPEEQ